MLDRLVSNSRPQAIRPPRPPNLLGLQARATPPGPVLTIFKLPVQRRSRARQGRRSAQAPKADVEVMRGSTDPGQCAAQRRAAKPSGRGSDVTARDVEAGQLADGAGRPLAEGPRPHLVRQGPGAMRGPEPRGGTGSRAGGGARGAAGRPWLQEREEAAHGPEQGGLRGGLQAGRRRPRGEGRGPAAGAGERQWLRGPRGDVPRGQGGRQTGAVCIHASPRRERRARDLGSLGQEEAAGGGSDGKQL
nr:multiple myeloma tumor-associated protein 2 isoform X4 [Pan troglodytes]